MMNQQPEENPMTDTFGEDPYDERDNLPLPKDLDMSDVNADAQSMYQEELDRLADNLDAVDLFTVLVMLHDAEDGGMLFADFLRTNPLAEDLIKYSQSDPSSSHATLLRMKELDDAIASL
jgi:hypothetical protein